MKPPQPVNWALLGLGKIAHKFADDLRKVPGARLWACASTNLDRAQKFSETYQIQNVFGDYVSMLQHPDVDVVYVATPHAFHHAHTLLVLQHGKAVLCEKPMALNHGQVEEMIKTAAQKKCFLMEALWTRFLPHFEWLEAFVKQGSLGKVTHIEADFGVNFPFDASSRLYDPALGGGSLLDLGIYPVFLAYFLLGKPNDISAQAQFTPTGVDARCEINLSYPDGVSAQLMSTVLKQTQTRAVISFDKGKIILHSRFHEPTSVSVYQGDILTFEKDFTNNHRGYFYEALHVTNCLQQGLIESPLLPHSFSLGLIEVLDAIRSQVGLKYLAD